MTEIHSDGGLAALANRKEHSLPEVTKRAV